MADGKLIFDTLINNEGFKSGMEKLGSLASTGAKAIVGAVAGVSTALAGAGLAAIKVGSEFETSMAKASTLFGDVAVDTDNLNKKILEISSTTGVAASELNESLYSALSAGIPATEDMADATAFLESSAKLAKAGFTDMDTALSATAKTLNAYGMGVDEADKIQKVLIQTQNKGITTVGELGASLSQVTPTAAAFGVSFEQVGASLSNMTAAGTATAQATTQLNALIAELGKAGTIGAKGLEKAAAGSKWAGMSFSEMMDNGAQLNEILDLMDGYAKENNLSMVDMFSSIEAGKAALALSGENSAKFSENLAAMATDADVVGDAYDKVSNTLENNVGKIKNSLANLGVSIYQDIDGPIANVAASAAGMVEQLQQAFNEGGFEGMVSGLGGMLADVVTGIADNAPKMIDMAVLTIQSFVNGLSENAGDIVDGAAAIIESLANGILELLPSLGALGYDMLVAIKDKLVESLPELIPAAVQMLTDFVSYALENIGSILTIGAEIIGAIIEGIVNAIPVLIGSIPGLLQSLIQGFGEFLVVMDQVGTDIINGIINGIKAAGGALIEAGKNAVSGLVDGIKGFLGIKSPSRVMKKMFEGDFTDGIVRGIEAGQTKITAATKAMSSAAIRTAKKNGGSYREVGKNYIDLMAEGINDSKNGLISALDDTANAALEARQEALDAELNLILEEKEKQKSGAGKAEKERISKEIEIIKEGFKKQKEEYTTSANAVMDSYKEALSNGATEARELIESKISAITEAAQEQYDALIQKQNDMQKKLSEYGDLFSYDDDENMVLANIDDTIDALDRYDEALTRLKERGASGDFLAEVTNMDVGEGTAFAEKLLSLSDSQFDNYTTNWETQQKKAREIAEKFYADELELLDKQYTEDLDNALAEIPDLVKDIGVDTIKGLTDGMLSEKSTAVAAARDIADAVKSELQGAFDVHSPSRWARDIIGKNIVLGISAGYKDGLPTLKEDLEKSMSALNALQMEVQASQSMRPVTTAEVVRENTTVRETATNTIIKEKVVGIDFQGSGKEIARLLRPRIVDEERRVGNGLIMNKG